MLEMGNPVHAFDLDCFGSNEVVVRMARQDEKLVTLDGKEHKLTPDVLLITNGKEAKAAAGVMGGLDSEVTGETKNILLEVAYFDPSVIRRGRKELGFVSEASIRFEKGVDPNNIPTASDRVAYYFEQFCGGEVLDGIVDCYPKEIKPQTVEMRPKRCNDILGTSIKTERMMQIFKGLEFGVEGDNPIKVSVPTFRPDITREIDLIEEVVRIEGFDSIPDAVSNIGPLFTPLLAEDVFRKRVTRVLTGAGFDEMMGHGLADSQLAEQLNPELPQLRIVNPVSEDLNIMRNDLALTALAAVQHNIAHRNLDLRLFEIGKAYFPPDDQGGWLEDERLLVFVTGSTPLSWRDRRRDLDFYDITGVLDQLKNHFRWPAFELKPTSLGFLDSEISFEVCMDGQCIGSIGQLDGKLGLKYDIKQPVYLAQLRLHPLQELKTGPAEFSALPVYPAAPRDLAMVVNDSVEVGSILKTVRSIAGEMAESARVFDVYTGKQVGEGKKSVGVSISYRSASRSLSSEEVDQVQQKITARLKKEFSAEIRDW
ncbi:MAG: phenylalanine--tRNA ligase subunit beta [Candidatus Zixiibacteriota bacterium]|nr:MAG: phenylalanine--tRNA ligase subunit beta [candidate division Zixibacteria bacterium]